MLTAYLLALAGAGGFSMMVLEVAAPRLLAPYFGSSNYTWTNVIGVILAALAAGYYAGGRLADRRPGLGPLVTVAILAAVLSAGVPWAVRALCPLLVPEAAAESSAVPLLVRASLFATLLLFAPPLFLMGAMSPMTVRLLSRAGGVGWASGACSASVTAGAIAGTFGTTLWLVPAIGSHRTVLLASLALLVIALPGLAGGSGPLARATGAVGTVFVAVSAAVPPGPVLPGPNVLYETETPYQYARVTRRGDALLLQTEGQRRGAQAVLREGSFLSGGLVFDHFLGLPWLSGWRPGERLDLLVLGYGVGAVGRQVEHFFGPFSDLRIDGVEIDPELVEIGERFFGLDRGDPHLSLQIADARQYNLVSKRTYRAIVLDVFSRARQVPSHLATREFFETVKDRLRHGGVFGMNVIVPIADGEALPRLLESVRASFGEVFVERIPGSLNMLILARRDLPLDLTGASARLRAQDASRMASEFEDLRRLLLAGWQRAAKWPGRPGFAPLTDDGTPFEHLLLRDSLVAWSRLP
ncbi:MAG: hypothetical protein D6718_01190 [Acidobacteria bacterium]|nr:MAG: hypothetical protein D6718_01190 [Acidobacteriota bacterium]